METSLHSRPSSATSTFKLHVGVLSQMRDRSTSSSPNPHFAEQNIKPRFQNLQKKKRKKKKEKWEKLHFPCARIDKIILTFKGHREK